MSTGEWYSRDMTTTQVPPKPHRRGYHFKTPRASMPEDQRFWAKVDKTDGCWLWTAAKNKKGYGRFRAGGKMCKAHRVAYEWAHGTIPAGLKLDHTCHVHACVNPDHLRPATNAENQQNRQGARSGSTSGVRGVYKNRAKWQAKAKLAGKIHNLGSFVDLAEAETVVTEWRRIHMPYSLMDQKD